jgi:hypothetical protein
LDICCFHSVKDMSTVISKPRVCAVGIESVS